MRYVAVGALSESVVQQKRSALGEERVSLHLAQADTTMPLAPADRLSSELVNLTRRSYLPAHIQTVRYVSSLASAHQQS